MPTGKNMFDDDFDARFDKMWDRHEKVMSAAFDHPVRTALLTLGLYALYFAILVGIVAFFVWLVL